jgi:pSer/pThr/pTyr-binding forkhead associated (FHA) protein
MRRDARLILPDGRELELLGDTSAGRGEENHVVLDNPTVSRRHAIFAAGSGRWHVMDTGSLNGTFVNGERIPFGVALPLRHGDRVSLGSDMLVFSAPGERADADRTETLDGPPVPVAALSPFQARVVRCLCSDWLGGGGLDELPSN